VRNLDRKIDIERATITQTASGQQIETWEKLASVLSAAVTPVRGDERFTSAQFVAKQQVEFLIRWSLDVADVNPLDRIIYPASSDADSPELEPQIFDIIEVGEVGRREGLKIIAARRSEVPNA
jgi:SPP1 family predicted phage head-tail adaptor